MNYLTIFIWRQIKSPNISFILQNWWCLCNSSHPGILWWWWVQLLISRLDTNPGNEPCCIYHLHFLLVCPLTKLNVILQEAVAWPLEEAEAVAWPLAEAVAVAVDSAMVAALA